MKILDGKLVSEHIKSELSKAISNAQGRPGLAVILIGEDPASQVYVANKIKACQAVGIASFEYKKPKSITQKEVIELVQRLNKDSSVHGILVQLPLPPHLNTQEILQTIDPLKDADGLTDMSMGMLVAGRQRVAPCTPAGVIEILKYYNYDIAGKHAVVVGRSEIVGKPMALLLLQNNATVTICHSKTVDLKKEILRGDIVVVAAGKPEFLGKDDFKKEAIVIDVGIHRKSDGKLCGDVRSKELQVAAVTPVPGGVGPMTIAMLLKNTFELFKLSRGE